MTRTTWRLIYRFLVRLRSWLNVLIAAVRRRAYPARMAKAKDAAQ